MASEIDSKTAADTVEVFFYHAHVLEEAAAVVAAAGTVMCIPLAEHGDATMAVSDNIVKCKGKHVLVCADVSQDLLPKLTAIAKSLTFYFHRITHVSPNRNLITIVVPPLIRTEDPARKWLNAILPFKPFYAGMMIHISYSHSFGNMVPVLSGLTMEKDRLENLTGTGAVVLQSRSDLAWSEVYDEKSFTMKLGKLRAHIVMCSIDNDDLFHVFASTAAHRADYGVCWVPHFGQDKTTVVITTNQMRLIHEMIRVTRVLNGQTYLVDGCSYVCIHVDTWLYPSQECADHDLLDYLHSTAMASVCLTDVRKKKKKKNKNKQVTDEEGTEATEGIVPEVSERKE